MISFYYPWFLSTNLSYRYPIFKISSTVLYDIINNYKYYINNI